MYTLTPLLPCPAQFSYQTTPHSSMFFKPIKFEEIVVNPPNEIKRQSEEIFDRILVNYNDNYKKFRSNPLSNPLGDPWFRREAWRWDPYFSKENMVRKAFPGLGLALTAFTAYLIYDFIKPQAQSKEEE